MAIYKIITEETKENNYVTVFTDSISIKHTQKLTGRNKFQPM